MMEVNAKPQQEANPAVTANQEIPKLVKGSLHFLGARLRGARMLGMILAFGLMLGAGWFANVPALLLGGLVDQVSRSGPISSFLNVAGPLLLISLAILGRELFAFLRKLIVEGVATAVERDEFVRVIGHLLSVDLRSIAGEQIGALQKRIDRSIEGVIRLLKLTFLDFLPTAVVAGVAMYMAGSRHVYILLLMIAVSVAGTLLTMAQVRSQKGIRIELFRAKEGISAKVVELLLGIEYVRASGARRSEVSYSKGLARDLRAKEYRHHKWMMSYDAAKQLIEGAGFVGVIALGVWLAARGDASTGDILTFTVLYTSVAAPLRELHRVVDEGFEATLKVDDLRRLYELETDVGLQGRAKVPDTRSGRSGPAISCRDVTVTMSRQGNVKEDVLRKVNVEIVPGATVGIAGPSGSGKSTFAKAVLGLISHYEGVLKVLGEEVREIDKENLAKHTAYVSQAPFVVSGTVRKNATYGMEADAVTDSSILEALRAAQFSDQFLHRLGGLDGAIHEMGRNLSGGEKQRLVLARVLLKNAELVVLDEATAALDNVNEALVQSAIDTMARGATTVLVIAHRLTTLRNVDRILVFEEGAIVQDGSYASLAAEPGLFRQLLEVEKLKPRF